MGFAFNLFFVFVLAPLSGLLLLLWIFTKKKLFGIILGSTWLVLILLLIITGIIGIATAKQKLKKEDYYGSYVVNRDFYKGAQADWQYNSFRFEIRKDDSIFFYYTNKEAIIKTYKGMIETTAPYESARLIIKMEQPGHHILTSNPTTVRTSKGFYLVFHSPKFKNVFFKKGKWKQF